MDFTLDIIKQGYELPMRYEFNNHISISRCIRHKSVYKTINPYPMNSDLILDGGGNSWKMKVLCEELGTKHWERYSLDDFLEFYNLPVYCGIGNLITCSSDYYLFWDEKDFHLETACSNNMIAYRSPCGKSPYKNFLSDYDTPFPFPYFVSRKGYPILPVKIQRIDELISYLNALEWYNYDLSDIIRESKVLIDCRGHWQNVMAYSYEDDGFIISDFKNKGLLEFVNTRDIRFKFNEKDPSFDFNRPF